MDWTFELIIGHFPSRAEFNWIEIKIKIDKKSVH